MLDKLEDILESANNSKARIVQKYIEKPLILKNVFPQIQNKKFDLRQWVLVRSFHPLKIYMFSACYLRICSSEYDLEDTKNLYKHLTNFTLNKVEFSKNKNFDESVCKLSDFKNYLKVKEKKDWNKEILPNIKNLIINSLKSVAENIEQKSSCFEIYGYDILLDKTLKPWLLEVD